jgi:peptidoglycan/xylan/chitin deacetylase (PgdA/CDA1 family)
VRDNAGRPGVIRTNAAHRPAGRASRALAGRMLAAAAGLAVAHSGPGVTALRAVRVSLFPLLSGQVLSDHVALTFDDGPDPAATPLFLELLADRGVRATFFLLGSQVSKAPRLAADIADGGHEIGVHGWRHRYLPLRGPIATYDDLASAKEIIAATTGLDPWLFRPPYGVLSTAALISAGRLGLTPVLWSSWGREWVPGSTAETVHDTLSGGLAGGATVLLHDSDATSTPGSWQAALGALPKLLDECDRRGLRVGPLGEHGSHWRRPANQAVALG